MWSIKICIWAPLKELWWRGIVAVLGRVPGPSIKGMQVLKYVGTSDVIRAEY